MRIRSSHVYVQLILNNNEVDDFQRDLRYELLSM